MAEDAYLTPYRRWAARHGTGFDVTLWASPLTQRRRFEVFLQMLSFDGRRIVDAGCSRGDFCAYLVEQGVVYERYVGLDAVREVIDYANGQGFPNAEFHLADFLADAAALAKGNPQIVCVSGTLNTMTQRQAMRVLGHCWDAAGEALIFNYLPDTAGPGAPRQTHPARRLSTRKFMAWALKRTPLVAFRQDYFAHGHDATILMRKQG